MAILNNSNAISSGGYDINNSLRFRSSASAYLNRTPASVGNKKTWTVSAWVKYSGNNRGQIFGCVDTYIEFLSTNVIEINLRVSTTNYKFNTTQVFRDPSAWYHIVMAVDTTQATDTNRMKLYINGSQVTAFSLSSYPPQNYDTRVNATTAHSIGSYNDGASDFLDGYMTDMYFIDGQALTPSSFGETDTTTGSWKPKAYTGTYGTNGFYLKFSDIATTSGSNAGLGKDFSGNANYWTTNNISVTAGTTYDAMIDSPTLTSATVANYCVLSPLNYRTYTGSVVPTISNANLTVTQSSTIASCIGTATMGVTASGKYYWEATFVSGSGSNNSFLGVVAGQLQNTSAADLGYYSNEYAYRSGNGNKYSNNTLAAYGSSYTSGDVIGFALDLDAGTLTFYKNNTSQGVAYSSLSASETYFPAFDTYYNNTFAYNFGQRPFTYTPPSGFVRLNTYNLPDSTIKKGNTVMDATLYTGNGSTQTITNAASFKPDAVWIKSRSVVLDHLLSDSVRGASAYLQPNLTNAEGTAGTVITSFNSNGFSIGSSVTINDNTSTFVAWQWQAGQGTTSSNTSGTITSTVSVNASAGFSIITYAGVDSPSTNTIGHGLGVAPKFWIIKNRSGGTGAYNWVVNYNLTGTVNYLFLNSTQAANAQGSPWSTLPTSSVITLGANDTNTCNAGDNYVCYAWAEISGYSKAFSYTGNGSTDGSFVYTGFLPRFVMIKRTDTTGDWYMWDTARNTYDVITNTLLANSSAAETSATSIDALSNGFKLRNTTAGFNASSGTYIGMAWATNPFKNSNAF